MDQHRIQIIDALRGFALVGILYVHTVMYFLAGPIIPGLQETAITSLLDEMLGKSIYWIGLSKFFSIFSILFGLSFYIQMASARKKELNFTNRFLWKMVLLAGFGIIHWGFFPGDILTMYAIIGALLIPLSKLSDRTLVIFAILLQLGLGRVLSFAMNGNELIFSFNWYEEYSRFVKATMSGNLFDVFSASYPRYAQFWNEQLGLWGRFYSSLSYFILGVLLGRSGWLHNLSEHLSKFKWIFFYSLPCAIVFFLLHLYYVGGAWGLWQHDNNNWLAVVRFEINELFALFLSLTYASAFILLANKFSTSSLLNYLSSYGRTGLTTYLFQSLIGTFIFFNWGLGLINNMTVSETLFVFAILLFLQIVFSHLWLKKYHYGPLEWLWRSFTYLKWAPNKRS